MIYVTLALVAIILGCIAAIVRWWNLPEVAKARTERVKARQKGRTERAKARSEKWFKAWRDSRTNEGRF